MMARQLRVGHHAKAWVKRREPPARFIHGCEEVISQASDKRELAGQLIGVHGKTAHHVLINVGAVAAYTSDGRQAWGRAASEQINQPGHGSVNGWPQVCP